MVDDTMEISSDHEQGDGDIDIDLDLTGDTVDEDFILEDATSNFDFGNEFHHQPPTPANDDIMVDDDNESYQMEDAELLEEEAQHIIEQESISFAADGDASYYGAGGHLGEEHIAGNPGGVSFEGYDAANEELAGFDLQQESEAVLPEDSHQKLDEPLSKSTEDGAKGTAAEESQTSSPSRQSVPPSAPAEPRSPPASVLEPGPSPSRSTHDHTDPVSPYDADNSPVDISSMKDTSILNHVVVVYRQVDYALFSTSEHDDPDLYFLSDKTIAEKPLSGFFRAIREVIRNDLVDEDELCIVVESLGLQAEEVSSFVDEVTLLQVLDLHEKLADNDGIGRPGGCHILLKTRTNFSRRFSNLAAGAAEGKGLSQFAYWDGQSNGLDSSEELQEGKYDSESNIEGQGLDEATGDYDEQQQYENVEDNGIVHDLGEEDRHNGLQKSENESESIQQAALSDVASSGGVPVVVSPRSTAPKSPEKAKERDSDVDEDGDLIDYSDDEDVIIEEKRKAARNTDKHGVATEEFEQRDELLRRRSVDRRQSSAAVPPEVHDRGAEEAVVEHEENEEEVEEAMLKHQQSNDAGETNPHAEEGGVGHEEFGHTFEKGEYTDQKEFGYEQFEAQESEDVDENDYENFNDNNLDYGHEQTEYAALASNNAAEFDTENDENNAIVEQYGLAENYVDVDLDPEFAAAQSANFFEKDGLDLDIGEGSSQDESKQNDDLLELDETNGHTSPQDASKANSLDVVETADSSVTMGLDEIQYEHTPVEEEARNVVHSDKSAPPKVESSHEIAEAIEEKDEIDYEDDEEEAEWALRSPPLVPEVQESQNVNGKRSIADVESNDSQTSQAKDAKRPRS